MNNDNHNETYTVKGFALIKLSNGSGSALDIQLDTGDYSEKDLIGKTLTTVEWFWIAPSSINNQKDSM